MADMSSRHQPLAVCTPGGGMAKQYRVQYRSPAEQCWHRYGTYRSRPEAEKCIEVLRQRGFRARIVPYTICPVAA